MIAVILALRLGKADNDPLRNHTILSIEISIPFNDDAEGYLRYSRCHAVAADEELRKAFLQSRYTLQHHDIHGAIPRMLLCFNDVSAASELISELPDKFQSSFLF